MFRSFDFCLPTKSTTVPSGPDWLHEIKLDGYRLRLERDGDRVRLITRGGYDRSHRYPWIIEGALKNHVRRFILDGEAVVLGVDGLADFNTPHKTTKRSSIRSTFSRSTEMISAPCPYRCEKPTWRGCTRAGSTAPSSRTTSQAK